MRLATLRDGSPDGRLVVVARDHARVARPSIATLQTALERWSEVEAELAGLSEALERGETGERVEPAQLTAPLPRAWQWLDGSAYPSHGALMQTAFNLPPIETDRPLMYQGMSDRFLGPTDDVRLPTEADGIDLEAEFGVILDQVPMGCPREAALAHVRLVVLINDWSLRAIAPVEMKTGFGWIQAKPACSLGPIAVTPDALGSAWADGRVGLVMHSAINGERLGAVPGAEGMAHGFDELIAHAARTRSLPAGTIVGSGTVSSPRHAEVGSSCLAERRAIEMIQAGAPRTPFLRFGDRVRIAAVKNDDQTPIFGVIDQQVVRAPAP